MPALVAVLLFLAPLALYLLWRRLGPVPGQPQSGVLVALLLGMGLALGGAVWLGFARSIGPEEAYAPARLGPDGRVQPGGTAPYGTAP